MNNRLQITIILKTALHGFRQGRVTGTANMEANLEQHLTRIFHEPLFQVFIDVRNSYKYFGRGRRMKIIRGYGMGPKLQRRLQRYWDEQKVLPKEGKFFGRPFHTQRGVTQVDLVSLPIFNIVVATVVRVVLLEVCGPKKGRHGFGWSKGEHNICVYEDSGVHSGVQPDIGADSTESNGMSVLYGRTTDKYEKDQVNGMHAGVHLGKTGS